jgi:guanylate kinase
MPLHPAIERRGLALVLSSPSGAGKTTLSRGLLDSEAGIAMSVSVTTRTPRPGEVDGRDYYFTDASGFARMRDAGDLLEWATVLFDIDWQGAQQLKDRMAGDLVRVFILPPSGAVLESRLRGRNQDPPEVVAKRMAEASNEISHWAEYDYVIVNDDIAASLAGLRSILTAERLKRERLLGLSAFVREMQTAL